MKLQCWCHASLNPAICLPFETMAEDAIQPMTAPSGKNGAPAISDDRTTKELTPISFDRNPLDPSLDSLRAAMGQLDRCCNLIKSGQFFAGGCQEF